jgi:SagB-type dehydrogenase family enzyme
MSDVALDRVCRYHEGTKHHFDRFARALGYLDWASQPRAFRAFEGAPVFTFQHRWPSRASAQQPLRNAVTYDQLFEERLSLAVPVTADAIGDLLRHALGLSAWKVLGAARWALRVNPSSGNLHPTEAYIVTGPLPEFGDVPGVWHYAPDRHAVEQRCALLPEVWPKLGIGEPGEAFLVALTSIHWRESWKYGERGFRYCQHDLGHAIAALSLAARVHGWRATMVPAWPHAALSALVGLDRDSDYVEAEREEPGCLLLVSASGSRSLAAHPEVLESVQRGQWFGRASQLSEDHVQWTFIDEVAEATRDPGRSLPMWGPPSASAEAMADRRNPGGGWSSGRSPLRPLEPRPHGGELDARRIILQRRSAVALDGVTALDRVRFERMLSNIVSRAGAPWDAMWWSPRIHLALFVHRVSGLEPGLYLLVRDEEALPHLKAALHPEFLWQHVGGPLPLWQLQAGVVRARSQRLSCDQTIAADGFFSLGMIAEFERSLSEEGPSFYRHLFWESGVVGQVLYLEAEAAGARGTGIGCFYDDAVHATLGIRDRALQSLYHFTVGIPIEDPRLTTEPGYPWER